MSINNSGSEGQLSEQQAALFAKARTALLVCVRRSRVALHYLAESLVDVELLVKYLRDRDAAFYNFRTIESLLLQRGFDFAIDSEGVAIARELNTVTVALRDSLRRYCEDLDGELQKLHRVRQGIKRFRSGALHQTNLTSYT